jgi:hypothetical protein
MKRSDQLRLGLLALAAATGIALGWIRRQWLVAGTVDPLPKDSAAQGQSH